MAEPLISIIIPTFNRQKFIEQTLQSVIDQQYKNWEVIIVDDGSSDNTKEIVKSFSDRDSRIKNLERTSLPKGASACRNIGLANAKGDYIIFLDSDDILTPWCFQQRITLMHQTPQLDFGVFHAKAFSKEIDDGHLHTTSITAKNQLYHFLAGHCTWQTMCPIWKKDFVLKLKGFDEDFQRFQDAEFHARALMEPDAIYKIFSGEEFDCYYRIGYEKKTKDFWSTVVDNNILFIRKILVPAEEKTDLRILRKSAEILTAFGITYCLRANRIKADIFLSEMEKLRSKNILPKNAYFKLKFFLSLFNKNLLDKYAGRKIISKYLVISSLQKLKQL